MRLGRPDQRAEDPVERPEHPLAEQVGRRATDRRPDRLADPDADQDAREHDERPDVGVQRGQRVLEQRQDEDRDGAAEDRAGEADDLGEGSGAEADDAGDADEDDHHQVEPIHVRSMDEPAPRGGTGSGGSTGRRSRQRVLAQVTVIVTGGMSLSVASIV